MKWILYLVVIIGVLAIGLYLFVKVYVGAVNTPFADYQFDRKVMDQQILVPDGFSLGVYAENIPKARLMAFTRKGDLLVAIPNRNRVMLLERDANGDGKADGSRVLLQGLNGPNGMDFYQGWLYIAETDGIGRVAFDHESGNVTGDYHRLVEGLPAGENHWKKTLRFGPDGMMYVTMGSSCNVCIEADERRATMVRYRPDGTGEQIFARGLRNSAGFDWSPRDGQIYATDNGRDMLGDDFPPCELNLVREGRHYGWPYANGDKISDPDFGEGNEALINSSISPVHGFRAHNAPLGIVFVRGDALPDAYRGSAIVALHGSWNRTEKDGYKVVSLHWDESGKIEERDFVTGFLQNDEVIGRPAEVAEGPDGAIYIADDYAGVIYRVFYGDGGRQMAASVAGTVHTPPATLVNSSGKTLSAFAPEKRKQLGEAGRALYEQYACLSCHAGEDASTIKLAQLGEKYNLDTLSDYIAAPTPPMPVFPLSEEEKQALAVYLIDTY